MTNPISFITANYVARQLDYNMTQGWSQGDKATNDFFRPLATFGERFDALLQEITSLGFTAIDLWQPHLNATWATADHIAIAQELLAQYQLPVISLAGGFGSTRAEFEAACKLAVALNCKILGGSAAVLQTDRDFVVGTLKAHGLVLGLENHPEKTPEVFLDKIGDPADGALGLCLDTGWFGTQGYDAAQAIEDLYPYLAHVHLKDVLAVGAHDTCGYGQGIVPIERCVRTLQRLGYRGGIGIEHEPHHSNPNPEVMAGLKLVQGWLT